MSPYIKISILPLTAVVCLFVIWMLIKPIYDGAKALNDVTKPQLESLVQQENEMQQRTEKLYSAINDGGQINTVLSAITPSEDPKDLIAQIEFLVNQEKMNLASITVEQKSNASSGASDVVPQTGKALRMVTGNFEIRGSYSQFKQLMADIAKLNRVVNIKQLEVASTTNEEGATTGKFTLSYTAYWQPAVTAEEVRNGLESMEYSKSNSTIPGILTNNLP
jgi:hypothetical protein